jgi:tetratricopeptide (TPR) repeat protein
MEKTDDWFRGDNWEKETQEVFEKKLKRVRSSFNKAQYLRIKANYLIKSNKASSIEAGVCLYKRLINEFPLEKTEAYSAYEILGDYYKRNKDYETSELHYRACLNYYKESRSGTSGIVDIKLAELIIESKQAEKYEEMFKILTDNFKETNGDLTFNDEKYRYFKALALLLFNLKKIEEAKEYAKMALQLSNIKDPQLDKHPQVGIIQTQEGEIELLKQIANL